MPSPNLKTRAQDLNLEIFKEPSNLKNGNINIKFWFDGDLKRL